MVICRSLVRCCLITILSVTCAALASPSGAQTLGTFSWQVEPYCNVVTFTVTADGPSFRLVGYDNDCGAGRIPAWGVATPNADGSVTLTFSLVSDAGSTSHTTARLLPPAYSGAWRDDAALTGMLTFGPSGSPAGSRRPVTEFQRRVIGQCGAGAFAQAVDASGNLQCGTPAGPGAGSVGSAQIADGSVGAADVNQNEIQRRVAGTCSSGLFLTGMGVGGNALCSDGSSASNVALGQTTLSANTVGVSDTAVGVSAMRENTTGSNNTAVGSRTLESNTTGSGNTAIGIMAMARNVDGGGNTAVGGQAMAANTSGGGNTAIGAFALPANTSGANNVAAGGVALGGNISGSRNVAIGVRALSAVTDGDSNVAIGTDALRLLTDGGRNIAIGDFAGGNLGVGNHNIAIGASGLPDESDTIRIGTGHEKTFLSGVRSKTTGNPNAVAVLVDSAGQLGTVSSSRRGKEDIHDMGDASAGLFALRPVTFRYRRAYADGSKPRDYGLIAEEVEAVYPDLVVRNDAGEVETVQYHKLVPMLLNELQRQQREIDRQRQALADQRAEIAALAAQFSRNALPPR